MVDKLPLIDGRILACILLLPRSVHGKKGLSFLLPPVWHNSRFQKRQSLFERRDDNLLHLATLPLGNLPRSLEQATGDKKTLT